MRGRVILDIGFAGSGSEKMQAGVAHSIICDKNVNSSIFGLDTDRASVITWKRRYKYDNSLLIVGDGFKLPFQDACFDAVFLGEVIEHIWKPVELLEETVRVLKKEGFLYLTTLNLFALKRLRTYVLKGEYGLGDEEHVLLFDPFTLKRILKHLGFRAVKSETRRCFVPIPFLDKNIEINTNLPPFSHLGTYLCIIAKK